MTTTIKHAIGVGRPQLPTMNKKILPAEKIGDKRSVSHNSHAQATQLNSMIQMAELPSLQQQLNQCFPLYALPAPIHYDRNTPLQYRIANKFRDVSTKN